MLQYGHIQQVFQSGLIEAVDIGERQHPVVVFTNDVDVTFQDDLVLRERPCLVSAEHIHRAEVLNCVEPLDDRLPPRHRDRALGEVRRDDHRQHLGREADGDGEPKEQASSQSCFVNPLMRMTTGTITRMNRMKSQLTLFTPTSNAVVTR